jgi:hypothetical protein
MRVDGGNNVEQASDNDEARPPVGDGELDRIGPKTHRATNDIEQPAAQIAHETEDFKNVVSAGVESTLHGKAQDEHADDGGSQQGAAAPFAQEKMSGAWDKPACDQGKKDEPALRAFGRTCALVFSFCHSFLTISQRAGVTGQRPGCKDRRLGYLFVG